MTGNFEAKPLNNNFSADTAAECALCEIIPQFFFQRKILREPEKPQKRD